jgi:hypothetical protein
VLAWVVNVLRRALVGAEQHQRGKKSVAGGTLAVQPVLAVTLATSGELSALASNVGPAPS